MAADKPASFHCPNGNALYQVVKVEIGPETVGREITCLCCETPLIGREGNLVVKYFLLRKGRRARSGERASQKQQNQKRPLPGLKETQRVRLWASRSVQDRGPHGPHRWFFLGR